MLRSWNKTPEEFAELSETDRMFIEAEWETEWEMIKRGIR